MANADTRNAQHTLKAGQHVNVQGWALDGAPTKEAAIICRRTAAMGALPLGYKPVRFDADGSRLLVHVSRMVAA